MASRDEGFNGPFGPGLPRVSDGSLLFLLHLISKMRPAAEGGSRLSIVSNRKPAQRKGKVQLIDASSFWQKMRKSLGSKRKELSPEHIEDITKIFDDFKKVTRGGVPISRIFKNDDFGCRTITVERPERDAKGNVVLLRPRARLHRLPQLRGRHRQGPHRQFQQRPPGGGPFR
jgi:type I restriction enzyme M protein